MGEGKLSCLIIPEAWEFGNLQCVGRVIGIGSLIVDSQHGCRPLARQVPEARRFALGQLDFWPGHHSLRSGGLVELLLFRELNISYAY